MENSSQEEIIKHFFNIGLSILDIEITLRQLNRILRKLGLFRRKFKASIISVISAIQIELAFSSSLFGYRMMHQKLRQS